MHAGLKRIGHFLSMLSISRTDGGVQVWRNRRIPIWVFSCYTERQREEYLPWERLTTECSSWL